MSVIRIEREGAIAVVVIDNPPVNASSHAVREGLLNAIHEIDAEAAVSGAVLIGAGRAFMGGADLREFDKPPMDPQLPEVIAALMDSPKPWVAAIHGAALGGGLELALGCDYRLATVGALLGLPEVTLGMMPGAGGTQHLPRLVGISRSIEMICSGRRVPAEEAAMLGLIDRAVEGDLRDAAIGYARSTAGKRRLRDLAVLPEDDPQAIESAERAARFAHTGRQIGAAIDAIKSSAKTPYALALASERSVFLQLRASPEAVELRRKFFGARARAAKDAPP